MQISKLYAIILDSSDFESLQSIPVVNCAEIHLFPIDDFVTLEYNDRVRLTFFPLFPFLFTSLEAVGEFIRPNTIVNIIDNDSKCFHTIKLFLKVKNS